MCLYGCCVWWLSPSGEHKLSTGKNPKRCVVCTIKSSSVVILIFLLSHLKTYSFLPLHLCLSCSFTPKTPPPYLYGNLEVFLGRSSQAPVLLWDYSLNLFKNLPFVRQFFTMKQTIRSPQPLSLTSSVTVGGVASTSGRFPLEAM